MDLVDRLYFRLREDLRPDVPGGAEPATIADIYQRLIPYRAIREELGIVELAQYEHALLRLLAGERGYLHVEVPEVREELRRELNSPNPILGIYRDYAAVHVRLGTGAASQAEAAAPEEGRPVPATPAPARAEEPVVAEETGAACHRCQAELPRVEDLRFCPGCGADQRERPCARCGAVVRADWNFCVRCGTPRAGLSA